VTADDKAEAARPKPPELAGTQPHGLGTDADLARSGDPPRPTMDEDEEDADADAR
jgi:hypothetical protein